MKATLTNLDRIIAFNYVKLNDCKLARLDVSINGKFVFAESVPARMSKADKQETEDALLWRVKSKLTTFQHNHHVDLDYDKIYKIYECILPRFYEPEILELSNGMPLTKVDF